MGFVVNQCLEPFYYMSSMSESCSSWKSSKCMLLNNIAHGSYRGCRCPFKLVRYCPDVRLDHVRMCGSPHIRTVKDPSFSICLRKQNLTHSFYSNPWTLRTCEACTPRPRCSMKYLLFMATSTVSLNTTRGDPFHVDLASFILH